MVHVFNKKVSVIPDVLGLTFFVIFDILNGDFGVAGLAHYFPVMWLMFNSGLVPYTTYWLSLLLVLTLFQGFFSRFTNFLFSQKTNISKLHFRNLFNIYFLQDIHPFYADLMNVLYDKDHYKLALGQINTARHLIDK